MATRWRNKKADLGLRLLEPLRLKIERAAKANGVSMNAEIVRRITDSFEHDRVKPMIRDAVSTGIDNYIKKQKRENSRPSWV